MTHLEIDRPEDVVPAAPSPATTIAPEHDPALNRRLYEEIGAEHDWVDHHGHDDAWWRERVRGRTTLVARVDGDVAGYAELVPVGEGAVELAYFGVRRAHRGRGVGGALLAHALTHALGPLGAARVVVETCDLDGPAALPNYRRRGLRVVRTTRERRRLHPAR